MEAGLPPGEAEALSRALKDAVLRSLIGGRGKARQGWKQPSGIKGNQRGQPTHSFIIHSSVHSPLVLQALRVGAWIVG